MKKLTFYLSIPFCENPFFNSMCLTETWLIPDEYLALNGSTPLSHDNCHMTRRTGHGLGVAAIYHASLGISPRPEFKFKSFEVLNTQTGK